MRRLSRRSLGWRLEVDSSRGSGSTVRVRTSPVKELRSGDRGPRRPVCSASRGVTGPARVADVPAGPPDATPPCAIDSSVAQHPRRRRRATTRQSRATTPGSSRPIRRSGTTATTSRRNCPRRRSKSSRELRCTSAPWTSDGPPTGCATPTPGWCCSASGSPACPFSPASSSGACCYRAPVTLCGGDRSPPGTSRDSSSARCFPRGWAGTRCAPWRSAG